MTNPLINTLKKCISICLQFAAQLEITVQAFISSCVPLLLQPQQDLLKPPANCGSRASDQACQMFSYYSNLTLAFYQFRITFKIQELKNLEPCMATHALLTLKSYCCRLIQVGICNCWGSVIVIFNNWMKCYWNPPYFMNKLDISTVIQMPIIFLTSTKCSANMLFVRSLSEKYVRHFKMQLKCIAVTSRAQMDLI